MARLFREFVLEGRPHVPNATIIPQWVEERFLARLPLAPPDACHELARGVSRPPPPPHCRDYTSLQWTVQGWDYSIPAHRYAYLREHGFIAPGLMVLHRCNYKPCCNFRHLYAGTAADNEADKLRDPVVVLRRLERAKRWSPEAQERARARATAAGIFCEAA